MLKDYSSLIKSIDKYKSDLILEDTSLNIGRLIAESVPRSNFFINFRYKSNDSVIEKLNRKGYDDIKKVTDLLGIKVVSKTIDEAYLIKDIISNNYKCVNVEDYYSNLKADGYKSIHIDIKINNVPFEIQVKDNINNMKQDICHSLIYKGSVPNFIKVKSNYELNSYLDDFFRSRDFGFGNYIRQGHLDYDFLKSKATNILCKNLLEEYSKEVLSIKCISKETINDLFELNAGRNTIVSIKDINNEYLSLGKKLGHGDFSASKDFDRYSRIVSDLRCAKVDFKANDNKNSIAQDIDNVIDNFR